MPDLFSLFYSYICQDQYAVQPVQDEIPKNLCSGSMPFNYLQRGPHVPPAWLSSSGVQNSGICLQYPYDEEIHQPFNWTVDCRKGKEFRRHALDLNDALDPPAGSKVAWPADLIDLINPLLYSWLYIYFYISLRLKMQGSLKMYCG